MVIAGKDPCERSVGHAIPWLFQVVAASISCPVGTAFVAGRDWIGTISIQDRSREIFNPWNIAEIFAKLGISCIYDIRYL